MAQAFEDGVCLRWEMVLEGQSGVLAVSQSLENFSRLLLAISRVARTSHGYFSRFLICDELGDANTSVRRWFVSSKEDVGLLFKDGAIIIGRSRFLFKDSCLKLTPALRSI